MLQTSRFKDQGPKSVIWRPYFQDLTFVSILFIGDFLQVDEMGGQRYVIHAAFIPHLDLHPPTQRREHLLEDHLFMPHRIGTALLHRGSPLKAKPERVSHGKKWQGPLPGPKKLFKPAGSVKLVAKHKNLLPPMVPTPCQALGTKASRLWSCSQEVPIILLGSG